MAHDFISLLRLHPRGEGAFESEPLVPGHLYGGYSLALAVRAAARTVASGLPLSSLHAVFPSAGDSGEPLQLRVQPVRDGRSSAIRRVTAGQARGIPLEVTASFHRSPDGTDWQPPQPPLPVPPEGIEPDRSLLLAMDPVEFRPAGRHRADTGTDVLSSLHPFWARPRTPLPDDPALHAAVVSFVSDYMVVAAARVPGQRLPRGARVASMNHSLWFHRPADASDWLLYSADPVRVSGDRGLVRGSVRDRSGAVVASFAQEVLTLRSRG